MKYYKPNVPEYMWSDKKRNDPAKLTKVRRSNDMREMEKLSRALASLISTASRKHKKKNAGGTRRVGRTRVLGPAQKMQNCIAKVRYGTSKAKHQVFLQEYLTQLHKKNVIEKPEVFSDQEITPEYLEWYKENMEENYFKIIVSPESQSLDMETFIKTLMKKLEAHQERKFYWFGSVHRDTDHVHAHILINGRDKAGKPIEKLSSKFISYDIRSIAREVCTDLLGYKSEQQLQREKERVYTQNRITVLDEEIKKKEKVLNDESDYYHSVVNTLNPELIKRLDHLIDLGFCKKSNQGKSMYKLEKDWYDKLRAIGRYNAFLKARNSLEGIDRRNLNLATEDSGTIVGKITQLYKMNDEDIWSHGLLIENKELNKAWYVPLFYEPNNILEDCDVTVIIRKNNKGLLTPMINIDRYAKPYDPSKVRK